MQECKKLLRGNTYEVLADITFRMVAFLIACFMERVISRRGKLQKQGNIHEIPIKP